MTQLSYDITSPESILEFARGLSGKSLAQATDLTGVVQNLSNKGDLGSMVERYYFHHVPPNTHAPDFAEAGVELKTTGVVKTKQNEYRAKERLVLTMINYVTLANEDWTANSLMEKCRLMLLLFYFYQKDVAVYDRKFVFKPLLWSFPEADLRVIENDWKTIQTTVRDGRAHELSEGDTFYLGACRKGSGGTKEALRKQPFSPIGAKSRAFSLKPNYINTILTGHAHEASIITTREESELGIEEITKRKFAPFVGQPIEAIAHSFALEIPGKNNKGFFYALTLKMLGSKKQIPPEFEKANITMKTIRLEKNGKPKESMSFPVFNYMDIIHEEWEESRFSQVLEQKFLFVVFQYDDEGTLRFKKIVFWNMPYIDREEARRVWELTKQQVIDGHSETLPGSKDSHVAHVRPHARDSRDTIPTPDGRMLVKKCFWLNNTYVASQIRSSTSAVR